MERISNLLQQWLIWWEACNDPFFKSLTSHCRSFFTSVAAGGRQQGGKCEGSGSTHHKVAFSSPSFLKVFWLRVDFQRQQKLGALLCPLSLAFLPELNMTQKLGCHGEKQPPDFMHALTYHRATVSAIWLPVYPFLSSASKLRNCTFLPFWHNYFLILYNTCFSLIIFMSEIKHCLCTWSPTDRSSFCTKLAQDQLAPGKFLPALSPRGNWILWSLSRALKTFSQISVSQWSSLPEHGQGNECKIFHCLWYDYQRPLLFTECLNATLDLQSNKGKSG